MWTTLIRLWVTELLIMLKHLIAQNPSLSVLEGLILITLATKNIADGWLKSICDTYSTVWVTTQRWDLFVWTTMTSTTLKTQVWTIKKLWNNRKLCIITHCVKQKKYYKINTCLNTNMWTKPKSCVTTHRVKQRIFKYLTLWNN